MLTHDVNDRLSGDAESLRMAKRAGQMLQITPSDREDLRLLATGHSTGDVAGLGISTVEMATQLESQASGNSAAGARGDDPPRRSRIRSRCASVPATPMGGRRFLLVIPDRGQELLAELSEPWVRRTAGPGSTAPSSRTFPTRDFSREGLEPRPPGPPERLQPGGSLSQRARGQGIG